MEFQRLKEFSELQGPLRLHLHFHCFTPRETMKSGYIEGQTAKVECKVYNQTGPKHLLYICQEARLLKMPQPGYGK